MSSQKTQSRSIALERCFACGLCNAASNEVPESRPDKVPELNALWTISMRRRKSFRHSGVRCSTNRQTLVAPAAGRFPTLQVLRRRWGTLFESLRSATTSSARSNLAMNYRLTCGVISNGPQHVLSVKKREELADWLNDSTMDEKLLQVEPVRIGDDKCLTHRPKRLSIGVPSSEQPPSREKGLRGQASAC